MKGLITFCSILLGLMISIQAHAATAMINGRVIQNTETYSLATTIAQFSGTKGTNSICSTFFAKDIKGHKYMWTAAHCCLFPEGESIRDISVLVGEGKDEKEMVLKNVFNATDPDRYGNDVCRIDISSVPITLKKWPIAAPEELDLNGESTEQAVLILSRFNDPSYTTQCGSVQMGLLLPWNNTIEPFASPYRVYTGCAFDGRSGSPVISLKSGHIIGVLTVAYWKRIPTKRRIGILGDLVGVSPMTYTSWYLDILLKKQSPPLPK